MNARTRSVVITSFLVLGVGLGTVLVAYYVGLPGRLGPGHPGPEELRYVPRDAALVAYADVHEVMTSELWRRVKSAVPLPGGDGRREFQEQTGIDVEQDVDRVTACLGSSTAVADVESAGLILARGRFDEVKIESVLRQHGARIEEHQGTRIVISDGFDRDRGGAGSDRGPAPSGRAFALAFVEPGLAALGSASLVRSVLDSRQADANVTGNADVMDQIRAVDGSSAWAVGRFDVLRSRAKLPENVASQIPAMTWVSFSGHVDGGLRGELRADARDEEAAGNLRDVIQGLLALAKLQAGSRPELKAVTESLQLGGTGKTVALSFDVPASAFELVGQAGSRGQNDRSR